MRLFTIGFTKKTAAKFFGLLRGSGAERVVDVRLNNVSQLAGFAKRDDLAFFLKEVADMDYVRTAGRWSVRPRGSSTTEIVALSVPAAGPLRRFSVTQYRKRLPTGHGHA